MGSTHLDIRNRLLLARLPAMPQLLLKLIELCQADEADMAELAELVGSDAGMTAKVLGIANSAAYQRGHRSADLLQALNTLGSDMLKTLVISESVFQTVNGFPHSRSTDLRAFWKHALTTAVMARGIAQHLRYAQVQEAYLCGLLHDVGRLALLSAAPNEYSANFLACDDEALCQVEQDSLQITHAEAGAWLIGQWKLDSFMADAVLYHHEDAARICIGHPLIRIVHLANRLASHPEDQPLPENADALCGLASPVLEALRATTASQVVREAELLGIDLTDVQEPTAAAMHMPAPPAPEPAQDQLQEEVRNMALTAELGAVLSRQKSETHLLDMARQSARILFNLDDSIILRIDESGTALVAASVGPRRQHLQDFTLPLAQGGRLAESVRQRQPSFLSAAEGPLGMIEEQLLRLFGQGCLVGIPLIIGSRCLGLLVGGIPQWRVQELRGRDRFLQAFGAKVAGALETVARERAEQERVMTNLRDDYQLQSRKVVHEVNNPLGIIKNYLGVLDDKVARQEPVAGEMAILHEEIDRVGHLVQEFAGTPPRSQPGRTDANRIARDLAQLFQGSRFLPAGVRIEAQTTEGAADIEASADTLKQILMNLVKNAIEALSQGGQIEIVNSGRAYQDGKVYIHLLVRDNGPGLPPDVLNRLFSPVRSRKPGSGRGLGLSIVHDLVRKAGGSISCTSNASGTAFDILLPAYVAEASGSSVPLRQEN